MYSKICSQEVKFRLFRVMFRQEETSRSTFFLFPPRSPLISLALLEENCALCMTVISSVYKDDHVKVPQTEPGEESSGSLCSSFCGISLATLTWCFFFLSFSSVLTLFFTLFHQWHVQISVPSILTPPACWRHLVVANRRMVLNSVLLTFPAWEKLKLCQKCNGSCFHLICTSLSLLWITNCHAVCEHCTSSGV